MSDPSASIAVSSLVADLAPYIASVAGVVIPLIITMAYNKLHQLTGIEVRKAQLAELDTFAKAEAGALIAASKTNLAGVSIPVNSPMIAAAADRVLDAAPKILADVGLSPASVAALVAGHLGALQASSPAPAAAVSTPPPIKEFSPLAPTSAGPSAKF